MYLLLLFVSGLGFAGTPFEIKPDKDEKVEGTYSAVLGNATVHVVMTKNSVSKNFTVTPYHLDDRSEVKALDPFVSKIQFEIASYHRNGETFTLVLYSSEKKTISILDYDLRSGSFTVGNEEQKLPYDNLFRLSDKTVLVEFNKKTNELEVKTITTGGKAVLTTIKASADTAKAFRKLSFAKPEAVNQQEFVKNGSIAPAKGYITRNAIIYTLSDSKETETFLFDLVEKKLAHSTIALDFPSEVRKTADYVIDDKLAVVGIDKNEVTMKVFDLDRGEAVRQFSLSDVKINPDAYSEYLKQVVKSNIAATVTVNKMRSGDLAVRIDRVDRNEYNYNHDWWHFQWFMQQMMWQQQMMRQQQMSMPRGFGPAHPADAEIDIVSEKTRAIEFTVSADFTQIGTDKSETLFPDVDKERYLDKYKDDKSKREFSAEFTNGEFRSVFFDNKTKTVKIVSEKM